MLRIRLLVWSEEAEIHIWTKHGVTTREAEEAAYHSRLVVRGRGRAVYEVFGRTEAGRYLLVVIRTLGKGAAKLITARSMTDTERRRYRHYALH